MYSGGFSGRRQPSRLQRRAPASIEIKQVADWNVAIPLLTPLVQSPNNLTAEIKACSSIDNGSTAAAEKAVVFIKKWQHPAAPFCYGATPFLPFACSTRPFG